MESSSADDAEAPAADADTEVGPGAATAPADTDSAASEAMTEVAQPAEPESTAAAPSEADVDGTAAQPSSRRSLRWWTTAALLSVLLLVSGYQGWLLSAHHQQEVAAAQALDAAEKYVITLTSIDPNAIDKNFAEVLDGATGEFKHLYAESSEHLRQLLIENQASAHGTVLEAAVKSATRNKVEVLLFVDQSVSNKSAPGPQLDRSRIVLTMAKVDGRWLASKVDMP